MLPKAHRLTRDAEFDQVFTESRPKHTPHLSGRAVTEEGPVRFGFVVGKRVSPRAVRRNRLKRQLRAATAARLTELAAGRWVVIVAKPGAEAVSWETLREELDSLFRDLKLRS